MQATAVMQARTKSYIFSQTQDETNESQKCKAIWKFCVRASAGASLGSVYLCLIYKQSPSIISDWKLSESLSNL